MTSLPLADVGLIETDPGMLIENLGITIAAAHRGLVVAVEMLLLVLIFKIDSMQLQHSGHQLVICNSTCFGSWFIQLADRIFDCC